MAPNTANPAGDSGVRQGIDETRGRVDAVIGTVAQSKQAVRAEIIGENRCSAEGCTVQAPAPVPALCRKLIEVGVNPDRPLLAYRGEVLSIIVKSIGAAAKLTVKERPYGPVFERWVPFPAPPVSPPMSKTGRKV
jgi:hypothetical protein